jgi:restriction endonuclease S subunit
MDKYINYKDSCIEWLGEIPVHWQIKKTKYICQFHTGWTPPTNKSELFYGDNKWLNISDISENKYIYDTENRISDDAIKQSNIQLSPKGSLLFSFKLSIGQVCFAGVDLYTNEAVATFTPSQVLNLHYAYYTFPICIIKNAKHNIYGAELLNQELIYSATLCYPPLHEQQQIADYLDNKTSKIDELIQKQNKLIETLKEKKKSLINHVVTKGIRPQAVMFDTNAFNNLIDNQELLNKLPKDIIYYATDIQMSEIKNTKCEQRRQNLLHVFDIVINKTVKNISKEWFVFNHSGFNHCRFANEIEVNNLKTISHTDSDNKAKHINDTLILLTAKFGYSNMLIISDDTGTPFKRAKKFNYQIMNLQNFITKYAFKESGIKWIGQIPKHWQVKKLKHVAKVNNGQDYKHIEDINGLYPVLGSGGEFARGNDYLFDGESILLGRKGTIDKPMFVSGRFWTVDTMFYTNVKKNMCIKFIYYQCLNIDFSRYVTSTALPSMTQLDLNNICFAIPCLEEQKKIANHLDQQTTKIDELITKAKSMVELLKEHKQSLINHVVTGKIKVIEHII